MFGIFKMYRRLADAEGQLLAANARIADLKEQVGILESEKRSLFDWLLHINGAPTLYSTPTPKPVQPQTAPPMVSARNAREYQRLAEEALNAPIAQFGQN